MNIAKLINTLVTPKYQPLHWVRIAPYGTFDHPFGKQKLEFASLNHLAIKHNSFWAWIMRGLHDSPVYHGHPDDPHYAKYQDASTLGRVRALEARADGLYAGISWTRHGKKYLTNQPHLFFSPRWEACEQPDKTFVPRRLLSLGLTNKPNLPQTTASVPHGCNWDTLCAQFVNPPATVSLNNDGSFLTHHTDFLNQVKAYMETHNVDYLTAWNTLKPTNPHLSL